MSIILHKLYMESLISGADSALKTPERNLNNAFYWMENRYGRRVPVAVELERQCLAKGYIHTDRAVCSDDLSQRVQAERKSQDPMERLADTLEKVVGGKSEEKPKRKRAPNKKTAPEEVEEEPAE